MHAYELIAAKKAWTQHANARDKDDNIVGVLDAEACRWCANGAIIHCYQDNWMKIASKFEQYLYEHYDAASIGLFNDHGTHEIVVEALKKAGI